MNQYDVCIIGGGPAGLLSALLLTERGRKVLLLEHHKDFTREYRGEVLMPRFLQQMQQVDLESWVETIPHLKIEGADFFVGDTKLGQIAFKDISPSAPKAMWMPQTQLLNALHARASKNPQYELWFESSPVSISENPGKAKTVRIKKGSEELEVTAKVVVAADGRYSQVKKLSPFPHRYEDYNFDVLWFTIPKPAHFENSVKVFFNGKWNCLVLPKYPNHLQCGLLIAPHELTEIRKQGVGILKEALPGIHPAFKEFADNLKDFTPFHVLQALLFYVENWAKEGIVLIGDAAHCCSPAGAIGVSVAVGTAIVASDVIHENLDKYPEVLPLEVLNEIQKRRESDVLEIHKIQRGIGRGLPLGSKFLRPLIPYILALLVKSPFFKRIQKRLMGLPHPLEIHSLNNQ